MRNNKGFGRYEILTVIVLMLIIFCILSVVMFGGISKQKIETMKKNAITFNSAVTTNIASFHNTETVYLQEAIDEKLIGEIKSPVGGGKCSPSESLVELIDGTPYVTLKCNNVLIEKSNLTDKKMNVYKVGKWEEKESKSNMEKKTLYNCVSKEKEVFNEYYEELYFVYEINKKYDTDYFFADNIESECKVVKKTFYRTKELIDK